MTYLYIIIAIIAVCLPLSFYLESVYANTYTWHIKKGHHYCSLWQRFVFYIFWIFRWKFTARIMIYEVQLEPSTECPDAKSLSYEINEANKDDFNKAPGFQDRLNKLQRRLTGWRCDGKKGTNFWNYTTCDYSHNGSEKEVITNENFHAIFYKTAVINPYSFATPLFVYFGGDEVAPHDMDITITGMVVK